MSDTPRTDALADRQLAELGRPLREADHKIQLWDHARQLERELLGAREEIALYEGTLKNREESIDYLRAQIVTGASAEAVSPANPSAGTAHQHPRTDAALYTDGHDDHADLVDADFARQLERELETVKKILVAVENQRNKLLLTFNLDLEPKEDGWLGPNHPGNDDRT